MLFMRDLFEIKDNFLEKFILRCVFLLLLVLLVSVASAVFEVHSIFLKISPAIIGLIIAYVIFLLILNRRKILGDFSKNRITYILLVGILLFCIFNSLFFFESKMEGVHDQGVYLESAVNLAKTGSLYVNDNIALTYPGFWLNQNGEIITKFVPGYTAYLSPFYHLFGFNGFPVANAILLFLGILVLYFLGRTLKDDKTGVLLAIFFMFSYYTLYFSRACFVENLQLLLVWTCVYLFIKGYKQNDLDLILYSSLPITLLLLVRTEAILYLGVYALLLSYFTFRKHLKINKRYYVGIMAALGLLTVAVCILYAYRFNMFIITGPIDYIGNFFSNPSQIHIPPDAPYNEQIFIWNFMFRVFNPICIPIMLALGLMNLAREKPVRKDIALIAILILPQLIFLVKPGITEYLPWYMRRFWAVFLPFVFLLFALFLTNIKSSLVKYPRVILPAIISVFLIVTFSQSAPILTFSEGKGLLDFQKRVSSNFGQADLVIFWDRYRYENYGPPLYFLYDTNVVFDRGPAFEPQLYAMLLKDYENIYIATSRLPTQSLAHPFFRDEDVEYIESVEADDLKLLSYRCDIREYLVWPERFKGYYQIEQKCRYDNPPTEAIDYSIKLNIYRVNGEAKAEFISEFYDPTYEQKLHDLKGDYQNKYLLGLD